MVDDPNFTVQGLWSDGRVAETDGDDDVEKAIKKAAKMASSPTFEGTAVRVLTRDGEVEWMWESPKHGSRPEFTKVAHGHLSVTGLSACFKSDGGEDFIAYGNVVLPPVLSHGCDRDAMVVRTQVDDPSWSFPVLDRELSQAEEERAGEALFQAAVDAVLARN